MTYRNYYVMKIAEYLVPERHDTHEHYLLKYLSSSLRPLRSAFGDHNCDFNLIDCGLE